MISVRTKQALARSAKKLGGYRGKSKVDSKLGTVALQEAADAFARSLAPIVTPLRQDGASLRQIAAQLDISGIHAPRGGTWSASQVARLVQRFDRPDRKSGGSPV
jgi:hypothetical protein